MSWASSFLIEGCFGWLKQGRLNALNCVEFSLAKLLRGLTYVGRSELNQASFAAAEATEWSPTHRVMLGRQIAESGDLMGDDGLEGP